MNSLDQSSSRLGAEGPQTGRSLLQGSRLSLGLECLCATRQWVWIVEGALVTAYLYLQQLSVWGSTALPVGNMLAIR